jgi:hypothetical protein
MKKANYIFLSIISVIVIGVFLIGGPTGATYSATMVNLNNTFSTGNFGGPPLQDRINRIVSDLLNDHVLDHVGWNDWGDLIKDYVEDGKKGTNIYGYVNPVSADQKPYHGQLVLNSDRIGSSKKNWNPMLFITSSLAYDHNWVKRSPDYSKLYGSLVIYKPFWEAHTVYYYVIEEDGQLGPLQSFQMP